jgi:hypothetical protein
MKSIIAYHHAGKSLFAISVLFLLLFLIINSFQFTTNVNYTQALLTISIATMIMGFIAYNGYEQDEFNTWLFFLTFILGVPLLYHLLYLGFFSRDPATKLQLLKIYILFVLMGYLTFIWMNTSTFIRRGITSTDTIFETVVYFLTRCIV